MGDSALSFVDFFLRQVFAMVANGHLELQAYNAEAVIMPSAEENRIPNIAEVVEISFAHGRDFFCSSNISKTQNPRVSSAAQCQALSWHL